MSTLNAADCLVDILDREGVQYIFGIPGGPILELCDAISRHPRIKFILTKHEQGAAYAAFCYARCSGNIGVCAATLGPGATNLVSGLPVAAAESIPVIAITGQVQIDAVGRGAHQESTGFFGTPDQTAMFKAVCKASVTCSVAQRLPDSLRHCIRIATSGRPGPTHLCLHSGVLRGPIVYCGLEANAYRMVADRPFDPAAAVRIAARLARASAPVILIGGRAAFPSCGTEIERLSKLGAIPMVADLSAKSVVDERSSLYLGCIGVLGNRSAEKFVKERADLILAIGQTFDEISTLAWDPAFVTGRELVQLDSYPDEIGKSFPVADAAIGHLGALVTAISDALEKLPLVGKAKRLTLIESLLQKDPLYSWPEMETDQEPMLPQRFVAALRKAIPDNALVLSDSSKWARWLGKYFCAAKGQIVSAHDYEPMGWAVGGSIGARLAAPDRPVICISGDGAFLMSGMEVATAYSHNLKIMWIVMCDSRLGIIYDLQKTLYGGRVVGTTFELPDLIQFAESMGCRGWRIQRSTDVAQTFKEALSDEGPVIVQVEFDSSEVPAVRPRSLLITQGMGLPNPTPGKETMQTLLKMLKEK